MCAHVPLVKTGKWHRYTPAGWTARAERAEEGGRRTRKYDCCVALGERRAGWQQEDSKVGQSEEVLDTEGWIA